MLNTSHIPVGRLYVFAEMSIQLFCSLFNQATFLGGGDYWVTGVACILIFWILTFVRYIDCKYFLPLHWSSFYFVDCFICCVEVFQFDVIPFVYFFPLSSVLLVSYPRNHCYGHLSRSFFHFLLGVLWFPLLYLSL